MAFPTISQSSTYNSSGNSFTSRTFSFGTPTVGDKMVMIVAVTLTASYSTITSGWSVAFNSSQGSLRTYAFYKTSNGSDGSFTITWGSNQVLAACWFRAAADNFIVGGTPSNAVTSTPNPPAAPTSGYVGGDALVVAGATMRNTASFSSWSSGYTGLVATNATSNPGTGAGCAYKTLANLTGEDPGTLSLDASVASQAWTVSFWNNPIIRDNALFWAFP